MAESLIDQAKKEIDKLKRDAAIAQKEEALYDKSLFFDRMMVSLDLSTIIYIILLDK